VLLDWWQESKWKSLKRKTLILAVIASLAILTKANAIALVAIVLVCVCFKKISLRRRVYMGLQFVSSVAAITWWYILGRIIVGNQTHIVGNIASNNPGLQIQNFSVLNLFVFRPMHVMMHPFTSAWSDTFGRAYYWEHLLKSAISGEWNFGQPTYPFIRIILACVFVLFLYGIWGFLRNIRAIRDQIPLLATAILLVLSQMYIVIDTKIGGFQDFRYVPILCVPFFYYALTGIRKTRSVVRHIGYMFPLVLIVSSFLLLYTLLFAMKVV